MEEQLLSLQWITYGLVPIVCSGLGFCSTVLLVRSLEFFGVVDEGDFIEHRRETGTEEVGVRKSRAEILESVNRRIPATNQLRCSLINACGPPAMANAAGAAIVLPLLVWGDGPVSLLDLPHWHELARQLVVMFIVGDFGLYLGHRAQHEVPYLYTNFHKLHHSVEAPTVVSVGYIHPVDPFLSAGLPIVLACVCAGAHPAAFSAYVFARVADHTINHCGYEHWLINTLFLKWLPLRATVSHHDEHHRFSAGLGGENFGDAFVVWDWMFGSLRPATSSDGFSK